MRQDLEPSDTKHEKHGTAKQSIRRERERDVARDVLAYHRWQGSQGRSSGDVAHDLGLSDRTLYQWLFRWKTDRLRIQTRGRPASPVDALTHREIASFLALVGPDVGVGTLRKLWPHLSKEALAHCLWRYRKNWLSKHSELIRSLHWTTPGTVWAIDYTEPPSPIEGEFPMILVVRDLASREQLLALPTRDATAQTTLHALRSLFVEHEPPLVLKADNGSHFVATEVREFLNHHQVFLLLSPPGYPQFNGAVEAGIGSLKTRAHHLAVVKNRPGHWTCDDVEGARLLNNALSSARTDDQALPAWRGDAARGTLSRETFMWTYIHQELEARRDLKLPMDETLDRKLQDRVDRIALGRVLVAHDLLCFKRRRITPALKSRKCASIS